MQKQLDEMMVCLRLRCYSPRTIKAYVSAVGFYLKFQNEDSGLRVENIRRFLLMKQERGVSPQTLNLYLQAIKFFYREIVKDFTVIDLKFAKRSLKLPVVLSREEIFRIIGTIINFKHRLMVSLAYGAGLRVSEVVGLRVGDVDLSGLTLHLKEAKGGKDRITVVPEKLVVDLEKIIAGKEKIDFVFASERRGKLTVRTAQKIFEMGVKRAGIGKSATFHSLRHSFATHLMENGTDTRYVQVLLGHQNIRTTQRYTQVTNPAIRNIKSPF